MLIKRHLRDLCLVRCEESAAMMAADVFAELDELRRELGKLCAESDAE